MRKILKASVVILPYIWSIVQFLGNVDFILERIKNPGWFGTVLDYLLKPAPAYIQAIVFLSASALLYWLYIRNKSAQTNPPIDSKAQPSNEVVKTFQGHIHSSIKAICDFTDVVIKYDGKHNVTKLAMFPQEERYEELEKTLKFHLNALEIIANRCNIPRFQLKLERPYDPMFTPKTINGGEDVRTWIMGWVTKYSGNLQGYLKDIVRNNGITLEQEYLNKYKDKLTEPYHEETNS